VTPYNKDWTRLAVKIIVDSISHLLSNPINFIFKLFSLGVETFAFIKYFLIGCIFSRTHMFGVPGQHTFFFPVDSAFDVSVQLSGYDYERGRPTGLNKMGVSENFNFIEEMAIF